MNTIQWPTAVVVVAGIAGLVTAAAMGVERETLVAIGGALVALAGAMKAVFGDEKTGRRDNREGGQ